MSQIHKDKAGEASAGSVVEKGSRLIDTGWRLANRNNNAISPSGTQTSRLRNFFIALNCDPSPLRLYTNARAIDGDDAIFTEINHILQPAEINTLREIAARATFIDGRLTNPHNTTKQNQQLNYQDEAYKTSAQLLRDALLRSEEFRNFAFATRVAPPLMCRYQPDMKYGKHPDVAFIPMNPTPLRSDLSCTIFLNDPATYDGGELRIHLGAKPIDIKGAAGSAVVYPSTTIHEVRPVTKGERLVAITFIQSQIEDEKKRYLLYTLNEVAALEGLKMEWDNRIALEHVRHSLHRMWST